MPNEKEAKEILERIEKKILNSPVLNGGWDKLVANVEVIKVQQQETKEKLEDIETKFYEPDKGIFSRIQHIESDMEQLNKIGESIEETKEKAKSANELAEKVKKLEDIEIKLSEPDKGIFSRIQHIETNIEKLNKISESIEETKEKAKSANELAEKVKKIAGDDLGSLKQIVTVSEKANTFVWGLIGTVFLGIANLLWEFYKAKR